MWHQDDDDVWRTWRMTLPSFLTPQAAAPRPDLGTDLRASRFETTLVYSEMFHGNIASFNFIVITNICFLLLPLKMLKWILTAGC
jgi:hypothetical protein